MDEQRLERIEHVVNNVYDLLTGENLQKGNGVIDRLDCVEGEIKAIKSNQSDIRSFQNRIYFKVGLIASGIGTIFGVIAAWVKDQL